MGADLIGPIIDIIYFYFVILHSLGEQVLQVFIIGFFLKLKPFGIVEELGQFAGIALTQEFSWSRYFFFHDHFVFGFRVLCLHVLPGQNTSQQIHDDIGDRLDVVSSGLLDAHVGVDACVSCSSR